MPDEQAFSLASLVSTAIQWLVAVGGGGVLGWFLRYRQIGIQQSESDHEVGKEIRDELREELRSMSARLDAVEEELEQERRDRVREQLQNMTLRHKLDLVIRMLNDMRKAQGLPFIDEDKLPVAPPIPFADDEQ